MPQKSNTSSVLSPNGRTHPPTQQSPAGTVGLLRQPDTPTIAVDHSIYNCSIGRSKSHAGTQGQNRGAAGPISALWEWDQDENHHHAQLDICTQSGPNPPGSLGAGTRQTDRQTDG